MSIKNRKGITVTGGFKLLAPNPIDARFIVKDADELQSIIDENAAYKGLTVWVESTNTQVVFNGTEFVPNTIGVEIEGLDNYATKEYTDNSFVRKKYTTNSGAEVSIDSNINYGVNILAKQDATTFIKAELKNTGGVLWTARKGNNQTDFTISHAGVKINNNLVATQDFVGKNYAPIIEGKVPTEYLPSYVDQIVEGYLLDGVFYDYYGDPIKGESSTIYIDLETNITYRYADVSGYIPISGSSSALDEETKTSIFTRLTNLEGNFDADGNALKAVSADKLDTELTIGGKKFNGLENVDVSLEDLGGVPTKSGDIEITHKDGKLVFINKGTEFNLSEEGLVVKTDKQDIISFTKTGATLDGSEIVTDAKITDRFQPLNSNLTTISSIQAEGKLEFKDGTWSMDNESYTKSTEFNTYVNSANVEIGTIKTDINTANTKIGTVETKVDGISLDTLKDSKGQTITDLISDKVTLNDLKDKFISKDSELELDQDSYLFKAEDNNLNNSSQVQILSTGINLTSVGVGTIANAPRVGLSLSPTGIKYTVKNANELNTTETTLTTPEKVQSIIDGYKDVKGGFPTLDDNLKLAARYMPSSVDEIHEGTYVSETSFLLNGATEPITKGESNKIYIDTSTNISYRWSGTQFSAIASTVALGYSSNTAYPGDEGKANANAIIDLQSTIAEHEKKIGNIDDSIEEYKNVNTRLDNLEDNFTNGVANEAAKVSHALTFNGYTKFDGTEDIVLTPDTIGAVPASASEGAYTQTIENGGGAIKLQSETTQGNITSLMINAVLGARITSNGTTSKIATEKYVESYAQPINDNLTNISNVSGTKGFLKLDANGDWVLDNSEYATNNTVVDYAYALRDGEGSITYTGLVATYLTKSDADTKIDTAIKDKVEGVYATHTELNQLESDMQSYYAPKSALDDVAYIDGQPTEDQIMLSSATSKTIKGSNKYIQSALTNSMLHVPTSNAVKTYVDLKVNALSTSIIGAAPEELNTLQELAKALGDNANFSTTVLNKIATKAEISALNTTNDNVERIEEDVKQLNASLNTTDEDVAALESKVNALNGDDIPISDTHDISIKEAIDSKLGTTEAEQTYYTKAEAEGTLGDIEDVLDQINGNGTMDSLPAVYYPLIDTISTSSTTEKYVKFKDVVGGDFKNVVFLFIPNTTSNYQFYEYGTGVTASPNTFSVKAGHPVRISFTQVYANAGLFGVTYEYIDSNTGASQCTAYRNLSIYRLDSVCFQSNNIGMLIQISAINNNNSNNSSTTVINTVKVGTDEGTIVLDNSIDLTPLIDCDVVHAAVVQEDSGYKLETLLISKYYYPSPINQYIFQGKFHMEDASYTIMLIPESKAIQCYDQNYNIMDNFYKFKFKGIKY